jgi:hypothetical protein
VSNVIDFKKAVEAGDAKLAEYVSDSFDLYRESQEEYITAATTKRGLTRVQAERSFGWIIRTAAQNENQRWLVDVMLAKPDITKKELFEAMKEYLKRGI